MGNQTKNKGFNFSLFLRVFSYTKPYKLQFIVGITLAILLAIFSPIRPYLIQFTVDTATGKHPIAPNWLHYFISTESLSNPAKFIVSVTLFQIAFIVVESIARFTFSFITSWIGQRIVKDLRVEVYNKVLHLNLRQFDKTPIGKLTTRTINDIESINDIFSDGIIDILADFLSIIFTISVMLYTDWKLTLMCLIPFPFLLIATYYFKETVNKSFIIVRNAVASLNSFVQEHVSGMQVVQAFGAEEREASKFENINNQYKKANIKSNFAYSLFFPFVELILSISLGILIWWISGHSINAGLLIAFQLYLNQIFRPLRIIADKFNVIQMGMVASERVFLLLDNDDILPPAPADAYRPEIVKGDVKFDHVYFAYNEDNYVLKDIDFHIKPGQTVALVGHTGSGKTSMISIINRLYPINKGFIKIDDVAIENYDVNELRKHIGVVLQDVFLFSGSILDNITLRNPKISREKAIEAAKIIGVHDFIMQLPGNYDYKVMERGSSLSLGQRQLISFIRALLYDPSILILDEATSSIDSESEKLVQKAIDTLIANRTSIIIAHRLSTIRKADKIMVLDKGNIIESGTHDELLDKKGFYAELHEMQYSTSEEE